MKKQGFTLVELIAVIAILGILALIATPAVIAIRNNVLHRTLETKISTIENAAKDYAMDNLKELKSVVDTPIADFDTFKANGGTTQSDDCTWITVDGLINQGYLNGSTTYNTVDGQKVEEIIDPVSGDAMNGRIVCVRYDTNNAMTRTIIAYIYEGNEF